MTKTSDPPPSATLRRRRALHRVMLVSLVVLAVGFITGYLTGGLADLTTPDGTPLAIPVWAYAVMAAWLVFVVVIVLRPTIAYWRAIDELARQAHLEAWFWGGSLGLAVGMVGVALFPAIARPLGLWEAFAAAGPADALVNGGFAVALTALLGYVLWWLVFWLRKR